MCLSVYFKWLQVPKYALCRSKIEVDKNIPVEIDAGLLAVTDPNPIDDEEYAWVASDSFPAIFCGTDNGGNVH